MARITGVDVSEHNGTVDWRGLKQAGVRFAIIRDGYGKSAEDSRFKYNIEQALANNIPVGVYHFSYALDVAGAKKEAERCLEIIKGYNVSLPVFFDFEYDTVRYASEHGVTLGKNQFNNHAVAFCETIEAAGYRAGVYYNLDYYNRMVDMSKIGKYVKWYAQYNSTPDISDWTIWQYSSSGTFSGVTGRFDMNVADESFLSSKYTAGWQQDDTGWWYQYVDGSYPKDKLVIIDGKWYAFDDRGYMVHDKSWAADNYTYTADSNGVVTWKERIEVPEETKFYKTVGELPDYYRAPIKKLMAAGFLNGKSGEGDSTVLDMSEEGVRVLVILERALEANGLM